MTSSVRAEPVGFTITVPESWFEIDIRPSTRDANIRALVYERVRENPEMREARPALVKILRDFARQAHDSGASYCACFAQPTTEGPITGCLTVSMVHAAGPKNSRDEILDLLVAKAPERDRDTWLTVSTIQLAEYGSVARTWGVEDLEWTKGATQRAVTMQTFVPLPGESRIALITASSPVLWLEESLLDLFDAVSSSFRLLPRHG